MIGEEFSFTVIFDNTGDQTGYGPFIDVVFPVNGADGDPADPGVTKDGISFIESAGAVYSGIQLTCEAMTFDSSGQITHPYYRDSTGDYVTVLGPAGDTFVSCLLPFGSFVPDQPEAAVTFQASLSEYADAGVPLPLRVRGGFRFGENPLDDWCCDQIAPQPTSHDSADWTGTYQSDVTPTILSLDKTYSGPEGETATGPNYPRQFTITVDVADGQTVENLELTDILPDNLQFLSVDSVSGNGTGTITPVSTPTTSTPGGTLTRRLDQVVGTAGGSDASLTFSFYIPRDDSGGGRVIDPATGDDVTSENNAAAVGDWVPIDSRDPGGTDNVTADGSGPEYTLDDKAVAVQKHVNNLNPPNSPGDILEYTYQIQVSDYFAFQDLVITDLISDGQHVVSGYTPRLSVNGNGGYTLSSTEMTAGNYEVSCNYSGTQGSECTLNDPAADDGTTTLVLRISDELVSQGRSSGRLLGGCVPISGGTADCGAQDDGPTTLTITYQTQIQQEFTDDYPSGDPSVDQGDTLSNQVEIQGGVLDNETLTFTGFAEADGSSAGVSIARAELQKAIYAINGSTAVPSPTTVRPGDEITFRVEYDLVTSDVEELYLTDYLPLPILDVDDPNGDGTTGDSWSLTGGADGKCANLGSGEFIAGSPAIPASGVVCLGAADTFTDYSGIVPSLTVDSPGNFLQFTYGDYDDSRDDPTTIEILFTAAVNNEPYADGLYFTNQAEVHEGSTNAGNQFTDTIIEFILQEPELVLDKGAVASDNPAAIFSPDPTGPVSFTAPGSGGVRWSGTISSEGLNTAPITSAVSGVDAGDLVSFALVIENLGSSSNGAFDIKVSDVIPEGFSIPGSGAGLNLSVYRGDGSGPLDYIGLGGGPDGVTDTADDLFDAGLEIVDPGSGVGACQQYDPASGTNLILVVYDLQVDDDIQPEEELENLGTVFNYANTEGGPDFTGEDADLQKSTTTTIAVPQIEKTLIDTNQDFTSGLDAAVGEILTYQIVITVPEGESLGVSLADTLEAGLAFDDLTAMSISADPGLSTGGTYSTFTDVLDNAVISAEGGGDENQGRVLTLDFDTVTNSDRDNTTPETITLTYDVAVLNSGSNDRGASQNNRAEWTWDLEGTPRTIADSAEEVVIVEPELELTKTFSAASGDAGDTLTVTIDLAHSGASDADAYDIVFTDVLPDDLTYAGGLDCTGGSLTPTCSESGGTITAGFSGSGSPFTLGETAQVTFDVTLDITVSPEQEISNTADLTWTSLPGDPGVQSGENTLSVERTGDTSDPGGAENNYAASDSDQVTIFSPGAVKELTGTDQAFTSGTDVTIGEILTYQATFTVPEGTSSSAQVVDTLDTGLAFVGLDSVVVSNPDTDGSGAGDDGLYSSVMTFDAVSGECTNCAAGTNPAITDSGRTITFDFGTLTNTNTDDAAAETITLIYRAVVLNTTGNQTGTALNNAAGFSWDGQSVSAAADNVSVVEPVIHTTKSVSPADADAGDTVTFTVTLANPATGSIRALDVEWSDALPGDLTYVAGTFGTGACDVPPDSSSDAGPFTASWTQIDPGQSCTFTFDATVDYSVSPGQIITNTTETTWTSLSGEVIDRSSYNAASDERTGADGVGGALNDYASRGSTDLQIDATAPAKYLTATSEAHTGDPGDGVQRLVIGEIVRYRLVVSLPEGTSTNFQLLDYLPDGLTFLDDGTAKAAFVSNDAGIVSSAYDGVPAVTDTDCRLTGNSADAGTPVIPAGCSYLANANSGSDNSTSSDPDNFSTGTDPYFKLGTLTNNDDDADAEYVIVEFNALVDNTSAGSNDAGDGRTNAFRVLIDGSQVGSISDPVTLTIAEPHLVTTKTLITAADDAADIVEYRLVVANNADSVYGSTEAAPAFEVNLTDNLSTMLNLDAVTVGAISGAGDGSCASQSVTPTNSLGNPGTVEIEISCLEPGQSLTVDLDATVVDDVPAHAQIPNTADAVGTSLPGTGTAGNSTGSDTPGTSGAGNGERDGSGGVNDYADADSANQTLAAPAIVKSISPDQYTIGEELTFTLIVTLPEGITENLVVVDDLPAGLAYVSHSVDSSGFAGSLSAPTETITAGSGGSLELNFGDTTTTADNDDTNNSFAVDVTARVLNLSINQDGDVLTNQGRVQYAGGSDLTDTVSVEIIEPLLLVAKTVTSLPSEVDGGGEVTYTVTVSHASGSRANAYDLIFEDVLPADLNLDLASVDVTLNGSAAGSANHSSGNTVNVSLASLPDDGSSLVIQYTAEIGNGVAPSQEIANTGGVVWTSRPGLEAEERDGSGGVNDYAASDSAALTIDSPTFIKLIASTDQAATGTGQDRPGVEDLAVGETVVYELTVTLPEGVSDPVQVVDDLPQPPAGVFQLVDACVVSYGGSLISIENQPAVCPTSSGTQSDAAGADGIADRVSYDFGRVENQPDNVVNSGDQIVIQVTARVLNDLANQNGDQLANSAELTAGSTNATAAADADLVEPELTVSKSVDDPTPANNQTVTFTLLIQHAGTSTADGFDLNLQDNLPAGFSYAAGSLAHTAGAAPDQLVDSAAPQLTAVWDAFPLGSTSTLTYQAVVSADIDPDQDLLNTAVLTWTSLSGPGIQERTGADGSGGLNDHRAEDSVISTTTNPDLSVTKDDGSTQYIPGTSTTYTIVVANLGNEDVTGAELTDLIPTQISSWDWDCSAVTGGASDCDGVIGSTADFSDQLNLPAGSTITYTVTASIPSNASGSLVNTVEVSLPDGFTDPTPANNIASDVNSSDAQADLSVVKDDGLTVIAPGETLEYTVVITNAGPSDVEGAELTDVIPTDILSWDWSCTAAAGGASGCDPASGLSTDFTDTVDLPAGSSLTYTVTARVSTTAADSLTNTAVVLPPAGVSDPNPANNNAADQDRIAEHDKFLSSSNQSFTIAPDSAIGEILTYQVTLTVPPGEMVDLVLTDIMDRGLAFLGCESVNAGSLATTAVGGFDAVCANPTVSAQPAGSPDPEDSGRRVQFDFGTLTNSTGEELGLVLNYRAVIINNLGNQSGADLGNQASWTWTGGSLADSAEPVTVREPDLSLVKEVDPKSAFPGQAVTFTLTVEHTGSSETPAYDVELTDVIPAGLTYVPGTLAHASGQVPDTLNDAGAPTLTVIWDEFARNGQNAVIEFEVTLDESLRRGDRVENSANLAWTSLPGDVSAPQSSYNTLSTERFYDPASPINIYGMDASVEVKVPALPDTGFAPGQMTHLPGQPREDGYRSLTDIRLEIPSLDLTLPVVSVPQTDRGWDLTWLWRGAGWLEGTAYPTWQGNTVLTGHAYLSNGMPGPFLDLENLTWGDEIIIKAHGQTYTYQIQEKELVSADDLSLLEHQERDWLTLFTCQGYDEAAEAYRWRLAVKAVLIRVERVE